MTLRRASKALRHLTYVSPNAAELLAMASAACAAHHWPLPWEGAAQSSGSQPAADGQRDSRAAGQPGQQQRQPQTQLQPRRAASDAQSARELLQGLVPHLAVLLKASFNPQLHGV